MREAKLVGLSPDGKLILAVAETGEEVAVVIDDRLRAAMRGDRARLGQLEITMESALRPRDIQARIRAGESPEAVAQVAQMPVERVMAFAGPVLAERDHIASIAQRAAVRRRGGTDAPTRNLGTWVTERLRSRAIDPNSAEWDAWRREDGRWAIRVVYTSIDDERLRTAMFAYDAPGRYAVPDDDEARWLVGEQTTAVVQANGARRLAAVDDFDIAPDHGADSYEAGFEQALDVARSRDDRHSGNGRRPADDRRSGNDRHDDRHDDRSDRYTDDRRTDDRYDDRRRDTREDHYDDRRADARDDRYDYRRADRGRTDASDDRHADRGRTDTRDARDDRREAARYDDEPSRDDGRSRYDDRQPAGPDERQRDGRQPAEPARLERSRGDRRRDDRYADQPGDDRVRDTRRPRVVPPPPADDEVLPADSVAELDLPEPVTRPHVVPAAPSSPDEEETVALERTEPAAEETAAAEPKKRSGRRKNQRASVPSWDEIMFGKKAD